MTLGENKKITLALIEEYSPNNQYLTDDEDIRARLNLVYSPAYQELAQIKKILKTKTLKEITGETSEGYTEYTLPSGMYQFKRIIGLDENNNVVEVPYRPIGKNKIYISNEVDANVILEYYAYPSVITEETSNDFSLELDQDVQMVLPYLVANDILKADPSADYTAFFREFQRKMESLDTSPTATTVTIEEGVI